MSRDAHNVTSTADEPEFVGRDINESDIGYIGEYATSPAIIRRLENARDWLAAKPTVGTATQRKRYKPGDESIIREIVIGCVNLLRQSPRNYSRWINEHKMEIRRADRSTVRKLVSLVISDVDSNPLPLRMSWHFDQFAGGELVTAAKRSKACVCEHCGKTFHPARKTKYCGENCKYWAGKKRRKLAGLDAGNVSEAA